MKSDVETLFWSISTMCNEALLLFNSNEEMQLCNDAALELLSHATLKTLHALPFSEIFTPARSSQPHSGSLLAMSALNEIEVLYEKKQITINVSVMNVQDEQWFALKAYGNLGTEDSEVQGFQESVTSFLSTVSHEFRTPMNGVIGFLELLQRTSLTPSQLEYTALIQDSSQLMMDKIENLLTLLEVQSKQLVAVHHECNLRALVMQLSENYCHIALAQKKQLFFLLDPKIPEVILADSDKILLILKNLISNALKFSEPNSVIVVELSSKKVAFDVQIEYSVTDTGMGIDVEKIEAMLEPFVHARENQKRGFDGFGIGLRLSQSLLHLMQSELHVASKELRGSKFSFSLHHRSIQASPFEFIGGIKAAIWPEEHNSEATAEILQRYLEYFEVDVVKIDGLASQTLQRVDVLFIVTQHLSSARLESIKASFSKLQVVPVFNRFIHMKMDEIIPLVDAVLTYPLLPEKVYDTLQHVQKRVPKSFLRVQPRKIVQRRSKILVAEDNPINKKLLHAILVQEGYDVVSVFNGEEAVEQFLKEKFDLVLMDIDMPVMDGIVANRLIKEIERTEHRTKAPVIALTAHALQGDKVQILDAGLDAHLAKPIDRPFLLRVIRNYLTEK